MRLRGIGRFWATSAILSVVVVFLSPGRIAWSYEYQEDFSTDKAAESNDTYYHSIFWPEGAYPPSDRPYLYYLEDGFQRELGFEGYYGVEAFLSYRFPIGTTLPQRALSGSLHFTVRKTYSTSTGYLLYQYSADGVNWEDPKQLSTGSHDIGMNSVRGTCYITFLGTGVLIDNLSVELSEEPTTIHVGPGQSTIQRAIDAARSGDIIEVAPGTYTGNENWDIDFRGKSITLRSAAGPAQTIIDCQGSHRGFYFSGNEGPDSVLRGFTIKNGYVQGSDIPADNASWTKTPTHPIGGGIYCEFSSPSIIDCVIQRCKAELGGGIGCAYGSPTIIDCVIEDCSAGGQGTLGSGGFGAGIGAIRDSVVEMIECQIEGNVGYHNSLGGGVYCWQSGIQLTGCTISSNSATGTIIGGGLYSGGSNSNLILTNCIVSENTADTGGGIFIGSAPWSSSDNIYESVTIVNCTIAHNNLSGGYSSSTGGGIHSETSSIAIRNSIIWGNDGKAVILQNPSMSRPVLYSDIDGGYSGQGNIDVDPLFASSGDSDYHLKSLIENGRYDPARNQWVKDSYHSPCIDAGDPQYPVHAEPLTNGSRINMGAYGGTAEASKGEGAWIFHVDNSSGSDWGNEGLSRSDAFATIQKAVDQAVNGDIIMVWPGTYSEEVILRGRSLTIQSAGDAAVITAPNDYAFSFFTAESSNCVLRNFVITGCEVGIYCSGASPTLANMTIIGNKLGIWGWDGANPDIVNCILWDNANRDLYHCEADYSCIEREDEASRGMNNFSEDPLFGNPAQGDYHLMSRHGRYSSVTKQWVYDQETSPCIDAGDPSMGVGPGRELKPNGGRINIGAYGGTPYASLSSSN